jgi:hypothetical protein
MTDIRRPVSRDHSREVIARWEKKIADRIARYERRLYERAIRLFDTEPERCSICGARTEESRTERCRGVCQ